MEVRLRETQKKQGHTRCDLCVEVKGSVETQGKRGKSREAWKLEGGLKVKQSFESQGKRGSEIEGDFKKKQGHTRCDLCLEVKGSVESEGKRRKSREACKRKKARKSSDISTLSLIHI